MAAGRGTMVVTHEGGLKFATDIRGHRLMVDQPAPVGEDSAPMPIELLGAALGTCIALYVQQFCHARGLDYEGMRVEVDPYGAQNPSRIGMFAVRVAMPKPLPPQYEEMLERVARSCPAHHTFVHGAEVAVEIQAPEAASA